MAGPSVKYLGFDAIQDRVGNPAARQTGKSGGFALVEANRRGRGGLALEQATLGAGAALFKHAAYVALAFAAAQRDAQLELQFFERLGAVLNGTPNMAVRYGLAHTNDHASVLSER
jgi:hypothetical protein